MNINFHPKFYKAYKSRIVRNKKLLQKAEYRIQIFKKDSNNPILKDHQLTGDQKDNRAFWITGDIRIIYYPISKNEVLFLDIGTHNQVY